MTSADDILNDRDRAARLDAFAEQAKQALTQAIAERDKAYDRIVELLAQHCSNATLIKELKNLTAQLQADKAELLEGLRAVSGRCTLEMQLIVDVLIKNHTIEGVSRND